MTNAEMAKHFASLPPDEEASIDVLNADSGLIETLEFDEANMHMLKQIEADEFLDESHADIEEEGDREAAANQIRETWVGTPVVFKKW